MRRASRRDSARSWIGSGAAVNVRAYARRYGVDRFTAHDDLLAIGYPLAPGDARWAVRPPATPRRPRPAPPDDSDNSDDIDPDWIWIGDQRMFVVGYTPGGAPYGYVEGLDDPFTSVLAYEDPACADRESQG